MMSWKKSLDTAGRALERERDALVRAANAIDEEIQAIDDRIATLRELAKRPGRAAEGSRKGQKRRLSPAGRKAISDAAKKRWARYRAEQNA